MWTQGSRRFLNLSCFQRSGENSPRMSIHWTLIAGFLYAEIGKNATTNSISRLRQEPGNWETEIQMTSYRHNSAPPGSFYIHQDVEQGAVYLDFISFIVSVWCLVLSLFFPLHSLFQVFKSRFLRGLESQLIYYFYVLVSNTYQVYFNWNLICTFHVVLE